MKKNRPIFFFETPQDKLRVFERPRLVMFSEGREIMSWENTQPLYFFPFSWLDYLGSEKIRELFIMNATPAFAEQQILLLDKGKVHFENLDMQLMMLAKERGHKVSIICNLEDLTQEHVANLARMDFVRIRVKNGQYHQLSLLSNLPNKGVLSCIKVYLGSGCHYHDLASQCRDMGINFIHVAKRLSDDSRNPPLSASEREDINALKELETTQFRVVIPSSLERMLAERFVISPNRGNVSSCLFSAYRVVLHKNAFYPCYTKQITMQEGFQQHDFQGVSQNCSDCACVYENDMLADIKDKMKRYKRPTFALEYHDN